MVRIPDDSTDFEDLDSLDGTGDLGPSKRIHELAWAVLDEQIAEDEMKELESLLLKDATAREDYIRCAMLHSDLTSHFAAPRNSANKSSKSPVLGFLSDGMPSIGTPAAEGLK